MEYQLLNEIFIRQRSEELQIPFENLLAAAVLEEIVYRIARSGHANNFWMKNSAKLNLENYRKKVDLVLSFIIKDTKGFYYEKEEVSKLCAEIFRNYKKSSVHWNYHVYIDADMITIDLIAKISSIKVPVKMKLEPVVQENLVPYQKEIQLFSNNNCKIQINCYPSEYVVSERFLEVLDKLELLNDLSCYMDIYDILRKETLSGRKVWELLLEGCRKRGIQVEERRFALLMSYRTNRFVEKKWKAYLRRQKRKQPEWDDVMDKVESFFSVIWDYLCRNIVYLGDWMPELGRCID